MSCVLLVCEALGELSDAYFLSLCQYPWHLVHSILCTAGLSVLSHALCVQVIFVRIPRTGLGIHSMPLTLQFQHLKYITNKRQQGLEIFVKN